VHELDRNAAPPHLAGDLRSGAVHDDDLVPLLGEPEDAICGLARNRAAYLDDESHDR
jgi:hypothetical protein